MKSKSESAQCAQIRKLAMSRQLLHSETAVLAFPEEPVQFKYRLPFKGLQSNLDESSLACKQPRLENPRRFSILVQLYKVLDTRQCE